MKTMQLNGFTSRRWHEGLSGKKFRAQMRRRAEKMGGTDDSVEIRDESGSLVDYYMCPTEYASSMRVGRAAGF